MIRIQNIIMIILSCFLKPFSFSLSFSLMSQVNGFEVHDPEEAILLFLEQDQDITLSVARLLKVSYNRRLED